MDLESIKREYGELVSVLCRKMYEDNGQAQDVARKIFDEIASRRKEFPPIYGLGPWVFTVAYNVIKNEPGIVARVILSKYPDTDYLPTKSKNISKKEYLVMGCDNCLSNVLMSIEEHDRLLLILRDVCRLPYKLIVELSNIEENLLCRKLTKIRRRLNAFFDRHCLLFSMKNAKCRCKRDTELIDLNIPDEFKSIRRDTHKVNLFHEADRLFPRVNYWVD